MSSSARCLCVLALLVLSLGILASGAEPSDAFDAPPAVSRSATNAPPAARAEPLSRVAGGGPSTGDMSQKRPAAAPAVAADLVRVTGCVRRNGQPLPLCDVSFCVARDVWRKRATDWGITDRRGRYEVELLPGSYVLSFQDAGLFSLTLLVPQSERELEFDIDLPR